jgi:hypothetical protein
MSIDFETNYCFALQRSAMYRWRNTSKHRFRSAGAKTLIGPKFYKHLVPPGPRVEILYSVSGVIDDHCTGLALYCLNS